MARLGTLALAAVVAAPNVSAQTRAAVDGLGSHLANVRAFAKTDGDRVWQGFGNAPFGFLLIMPGQEYLLCRDAVPEGFVRAGNDPATGCMRYARPRSAMPDTLLAAMPLFGPPSVIVMGTPRSTGRSEADWVRTILHEHFHQWQSALPDYYPRTLKLGLAGGDQTGMWMLNYPFPYDRVDVVQAHDAASLALAEALTARRSRDFISKFDAYLTKRAAFQKSAGAAAWRYAELQLWQEGVARWTEIVLGKDYPDADVRNGAARLEEATLAALRSPDLSGRKREFAYAYGAGEAMLLDACGSAWRRHYPSTLQLGTLLTDARINCGRRI